MSKYESRISLNKVNEFGDIEKENIEAQTIRFEFESTDISDIQMFNSLEWIVNVAIRNGFNTEKISEDIQNHLSQST